MAFFPLVAYIALSYVYLVQSYMNDFTSFYRQKVGIYGISNNHNSLITTATAQFS
jgi:hypothetical protein